MAKFTYSAFGDEIAPELEKQLDVMTQLNIHHLEIRRVNKKMVAEQTLEEIREIKRILTRKGCSISAIGSAIGKCSILYDFSEHLKEVNRVMNYAELLETNKIRMFSFVIPDGDDPYKYTDEVLRRLDYLVNLAAKRGFIFFHEDEKPVFGNNAARCEIVMREFFSDHFKMAFDPANFVQFGQETYPDCWNLLKKYVAHMHIKDALFSDKSVQVVGEGEGHVKEILSDLYKSNYDGFLVLEPHISAFEGHIAEEGTKIYDGPVGFHKAAEALKKMMEEIAAESA